MRLLISKIYDQLHVTILLNVDAGTMFCTKWTATNYLHLPACLSTSHHLLALLDISVIYIQNTKMGMLVTLSSAESSKIQKKVNSACYYP